MTRRVEYDESFFSTGLWYYYIRALPLKALKEEYNKDTIKKIKLFELLARMKWKTPDLVQWSVDDFRTEIRYQGLNNVLRVYRGRFGLPVIVPISNFFYRAFGSYPNLNTVYGERGSGKTIFGWITAYKVWQMNKDKFDEFKIYVYGDVDGLTEAIKKKAPPEFAKTLIKMEDYEPVEAEKRVGKFILFNELDKAILSGTNNLSKEKVAVDMMMFRSRHYQYWMFYNVIRYKSIQKTVRMTSSFQSIKPLSQKLMEEVVEEAFPAPYRNVVLQILGSLKYTEALTSIPLYRSDWMGIGNLGSKQTIMITPVIAPDWLIEATKIAVKDYSVGSEAMEKKVNEMVEIAAKKFLEGMSLNKVVEMMYGKYKFKMSYTWWRGKIREYFVEKGYEFENLKELQENERVRRISEKVVG